MRIAIATVAIPFMWGGAEILATGLEDALRAAGHQAQIVSVPFRWYPPAKILDAMLSSRLLDCSEFGGTPVDLMIGLKFPAYLMQHPRKVLWLLHQHRQAYELWDTPYGDLQQFPDGRSVRDAIVAADNLALRETRAVFTISKTVSERLERFNGHSGRALYPPPRSAERFFCEDAQPYLFFPSRLSAAKRQTLVLEALGHSRGSYSVIFAGDAENANIAAQVEQLADRLGLQARAKFLGMISEEEKLRYYAQATAVVYPPFDEDYGYCTLEAMLASKPVITVSDSGGPLEFVEHGVTGLIAHPDARELAQAMDTLMADRALAHRMGQAGREKYDVLGIGWDAVVGALLA